MTGLYFQRKAFLLGAFLLLWSLHVHCYRVTPWPGNMINVFCENKEHFNYASSTNYSKNINETMTARQLTIQRCPPPNKPYLETLRAINIDASRVTVMRFIQMPCTDLLTESMFEGMPLEKLSINGYDVSTNATGKLDLAKGDKYFLDCSRDNKDVFPNRLLNVSLVIIDGCTLPNVSYSDILRKLHIVPASVQELELHIVPDNLQLKPNIFKGLSLRKLRMTNEYDSNFFNIDTKTFEEIEINEVYLEQVRLKTFKQFRAKKVTLVDGEFVGNFFQNDCSTLTSLELNRFNFPQFPGGWLRHCLNLKDLSLIGISQKGAEEALMGTHTLINLYIDTCNYNNLTKPFAVDAVNLTRNAFSALKKLEELEIISFYKVDKFQIVQAVAPLKNLRKLTTDEPIEAFCDDYFQDYFPNRRIKHSLLGVESVYFCHSPLTSICFNSLNRTHLDLSYSSIIYLELLSLPVPHMRPITVDLRGNPLKTIFFDFDYEVTVKQFRGSIKLTILLNWTVECDCEHTPYVKALRELPQISLQNATCTSGERFINFTGEKFGCSKYPCDNCTCRTSSDDGTTIADCASKRLQTLPPVWKFINNGSQKAVMKKILASSNFIESLPEYGYPASLVEVDLSNNKLSRIPENTLKALFSNMNRRVNLSGNFFVCDCETQAMLTVLSLHSHQIPDYKYLMCSKRDTYLHELSGRSLCAERALRTLGLVSASLLALATIMSSLYFRYKLTIKAFLYARGLCLYCVREEELDADKEYNAFISFSGRDDELVAEELLPGLENDYKLCVHTRNWMPGEEIYAQIIKSVALSRRTIIVLTKNFVESVWGMVEFRTAYINALREGRVRVICIVVDDDINDMDLPPDLKAYLKSNTYLMWREPFFWQKLRYALPHPSVTHQSEVQIQNEGGENRCREIELVS